MLCAEISSYWFFVFQSEHIYLAEDGLELWCVLLYVFVNVKSVKPTFSERLALLSNARQPSLALVQLASNLIGLLGLGPPSDISSRSMPGIMGGWVGVLDWSCDTWWVCL